MKIVYNRCHGGFGLSKEATELYLTLTGQTPFYSDVQYGCTTYATTPFVDGHAQQGTYFHDFYLDRNDPILIQVVEQLGKKANGQFADLKIVDIPESATWEIHDYDGMETVREVSRYWS